LLDFDIVDVKNKTLKIHIVQMHCFILTIQTTPNDLF